MEAGLLFACKLRTDVDFLGRSALEAAGPRGPRRRLVSFVVDDPEPMLWGGELLLRDGRPVGQVTSAAWGETVGGLRRAGLRRRPLRYDHARLGERPAPTRSTSAAPCTRSRVRLRSPYDPDSVRVR